MTSRLAFARVCAKPGCGALVAVDRICCREHWYALPEYFRREFTPDMPSFERIMLFTRVQRFLQTKDPKPCRAAFGAALEAGVVVSPESCGCPSFDAAECPETGESLSTCECGHAAEEHR